MSDTLLGRPHRGADRDLFLGHTLSQPSNGRAERAVTPESVVSIVTSHHQMALLQERRSSCGLNGSRGEPYDETDFKLFIEHKTQRRKVKHVGRYLSENTDEECLDKISRRVRRYAVIACLCIVVLIIVTITAAIFANQQRSQPKVLNRDTSLYHSGGLPDIDVFYPPDNHSCAELEQTGAFCFLIKPANYTQLVGDTMEVFFECETNKSASFQWEHNGLVMEDSTLPDNVEVTTPSPAASFLYIKRPLGPRLAGRYTCVARHRDHVVRSSAWVVLETDVQKVTAPPTVHRAEPCAIQFLTTPTFTELQEGVTSSISCSTKSRDHITWLKDGQPISDKLITIDASRGTLTWKSPQLRHVGSYTCLASRDSLSKDCVARISTKVTLKTDSLQPSALNCGVRHSSKTTSTTKPTPAPPGGDSDTEDYTYDEYDDEDEDDNVDYNWLSVVGGDDTSRGHVPWQVMIYNVTGHVLKCGGALIDRRHVITAAHCLGQGHDLELRIGAHNIRFRSAGERRYRQYRTCKHPSYRHASKTFDYDLAILRLPEPVTFTLYVSPVCVPALPAGGVRPLARISGWGATGQGHPDVLQEVTLPIQSRDVCRKSTREKVTPRMLCAGSDSDVSTADACQGDSGGPLVVSRTTKSAGYVQETTNTTQERWFIEGVVSWGVGCGYRGYYTNVSAFHTWIVSTVHRWDTGQTPICLS